MTPDRDTVRAVRQALSDPAIVAEKLGLKPHGKGTYTLVFCPVHAEKNDPSCSLRRKDGTIGVRCFGCGWTGDVLTLIAAVEGLDPAREFRAVLAAACDLAGMRDEADAVRGGQPAPARRTLPRQADPEPERDYPPLAEVVDLWLGAQPVTADDEACGMLEGRKIDPDGVSRIGAARALHPDTHRERLPAWAKFRGRLLTSKSWLATGHRLIVPVYDFTGAMRSVRAWLVTGEANLPKRVPPAGFRASGLVLANARALRWLRGDGSPSSIVVCEGEPDWLVRAITFPSEVIIGIGSGSWTPEFAERVPYGSQVTILTHLDSAGERYADVIEKSVKDRAQVYRWTLNEDEAAA